MPKSCSVTFFSSKVNYSCGIIIIVEDISCDIFLFIFSEQTKKVNKSAARCHFFDTFRISNFHANNDFSCQFMWVVYKEDIEYVNSARVY